MQGEDKLANFEVYIPEDAEVKSIPLWTLPVPTLRRMGLPSVTRGSAKDGSLASATWISPVEIRERDCPAAKLNTADTAKAKMTSLLNQEQASASGPYLLPFVTSSSTAFSVLGKFLPHSEDLKQQSPGRINPLPSGEPPRPYQDGVIIYRGRIYLSVKKSKSAKSARGLSNTGLLSMAVSPRHTPERNIVSSSTGDVESQESCPVPTSCNAVTKKTLLQRFGVTRKAIVALTRVTLPPDPQQIEQEKAKNLSCFQSGKEEEISWNTEQISMVDEQMEGAGDVSDCGQGENAEDVSNGGQGENAEDVAQGEQGENAEDVATGEPGECAADVAEGEQGESAMDVSAQDSDESWIPQFPQILSFARMGPRHSFDFEHSAREEAIDRIRAQIRESEAALNKLPR